jgi:hypothetical protein
MAQARANLELVRAAIDELGEGRDASAIAVHLRNIGVATK